MGMALGAAIGTAVTVPLYQLAGSWRFPFLVFGLLTLFLPALFQAQLRPARPAPQSASGGVSRVLRDRSVVALFAINFCSAYSVTVLTTWGPSFLSGEPWLLLVAVVALGLTGKWSSDGVLAGWMADHVATKYAPLANTVYGVGNTARLSGSLLAPLVTGVLLDLLGSLATGFFVGAGLLLLAACLAVVVLERPQPQHPVPSSREEAHEYVPAR